MLERKTAKKPEPFYRVRVCRLPTGERLPLVIDRRGLPVAEPNRWALILRRQQVQQNTLADNLRTVAHVHDWAERRGIDLSDRFASGNGLQPAELNALYQNLRYERPSGRHAAAGKLKDARDLLIVDWKTHAGRVTLARDYLLWGLEQTLYAMDISDQRLPAMHARCDLIRRQAIEFQREGTDNKPPRQGLSPDLRSELLAIIEPSSVRNPYNKTARFRNYVLILLMLTFGFRRGEILTLKLSDVNVRGRSPSITVVRRPGDPEETRANAPAVKTLGRTLPLQPECAKVLNEYLQQHRSRYPGSDASPFFFLSSWGEPLSLRSVNAMLEQLVHRHPQFAELLTPHVLRYTYNDMLAESAQAANMDGETFKAARNYLNGWSATSDQGSLYSRRANEERARQISLKHQAGLFR